jgi:hypothetical protein
MGFQLGLWVALKPNNGSRQPLVWHWAIQTLQDRVRPPAAGQGKVILDHWYRSGTPFLSEEIHLFSEIEDLQSWAVNASELNLLAIRLTLRNPLSTLEWLSSIYDYILQIRQPPNDRVGYVELSVYDNPLASSQTTNYRCSNQS